jgi:hypothetical protein
MLRSAHVVHTALTHALDELRRSERGAVLLFAEVMQRELYRELGFASIHAYALESLDFSPSKTAQFIQLAKRLDELPRLRRAVETGEVTWTGARSVAGVATSDSEGEWVEQAKRLSRRQLAKKIDRARKDVRRRRRSNPAQGTLEPAPKPATATAASRSLEPTPEPEVMVEVKLRFTATQYARYQALIESRRKQGRHVSREELVLEGLASDAGAARHSAPPYRIVTYMCDTCGNADTPTPRGNLRIPLAELQAQISDAEIVSPAGRRRKTIPPAVRAKVLARDGHRCAAEGCGATQFLEVHHRVPVAAGGTNDSENLVTLCHRCHRALHGWKGNSHISQQYTRVLRTRHAARCEDHPDPADAPGTESGAESGAESAPAPPSAPVPTCDRIGPIFPSSTPVTAFRMLSG